MALVLALKPARPAESFSHLYRAQECGGVGAPCMVSGRQYSVLIPKGKGPFPAVIFLHGPRGTGQRVIQSAFLVKPILERGYAIVAPTALEIEYRNGPGTGWVWHDANYGRDDFEFIANMLEDVLARFPVDPAQIVTTGHSRGGSFAWYLAFADIDPRLKAFAPIAGTPVRGQPGDCASADFDFDMFYSHGHDDTVIPFAGSGSSRSDPGYMGAVEATLTLASSAGCQKDEVVETDSHDQRVLSDCDSGSTISVIGYEAGHGVPSGWSDLMLDWFETVNALE